MTRPDPTSLDHGIAEIRDRIGQVVNGPTKPFSRERSKALSEIKWFLGTADGHAAGLKGLRTALVKLEEAQVFDGRDNEVLKKAFYEAALGVSLFVVPLEQTDL